MKKGKVDQGLVVGQEVLTPDGISALVVNVGETGVIVRFVPGESLGIYPHGALRPAKLQKEEEVS